MLDVDREDLVNTLSDDVRKITICPICSAKLNWVGNEICCANPECDRAFTISGGIPVLADEETSPISFDWRASGTNKSTAKSIALRYLPALDLNVVPKSVKDRMKEEIFALSSRPVIVNVGGKHPTSITEELCARDDILAIECDLAYRARTRIFADPSKIPIADGAVDAVLLDGLLEHVPDPGAVVREAWRVLRPGGIIYSDTPFMLQVHGGAFDFLRFSHQAQRWLFREFDELESGVSSGPGVALGYAIQYFLLCFVSGRTGRYAVKSFSRLAFFWIKYFDLLIAQRPAARDAAHGIYFLGRKSNKALTQRQLVERYDGEVPHLYSPNL